MNNQTAYNKWSETYDTVENKTRDIEAKALREMISGEYPDVLEIACGTGKNTEFLQTKAKHLTAVDFSEEMLAKAKRKITSENVVFKQLDLRETWDFADESFELITCSLALEHIKNLDFIFAEAARVLRANGKFYFGELHPFKQYQGTKARFETGEGIFELECFVHNVSEYFIAAKQSALECVEIKEWFDDDDKTNIPRLLTMIFKKTK